MDTSAYSDLNKMQEYHWWFKGRKKIIEYIIQKYAPESGKFKRAIDIGCGPGVNIELVEKYVEKICGLDNSDEAIKFAQENHPKTNFIKSDFPFVSIVEHYDLITMLDVLEHIEDDQKSLEVVANMLDENGVAIITVPAFKILWTAHDERMHHKRRYLLGELREKISNIPSLQIDYIGYFNFVLFLPVLFFRIIKKAFRLSDKNDLFLPPKLINTILYNIFLFEKWLLRWFKFPFGVSIICVVRKKAYNK